MDSFQQQLSDTQQTQETIQQTQDSFQQTLDSFQQIQDSFLQRLVSLEDKVESVHRSQITFEKGHGPRIAAALDGYSVNKDKLDEHEGRISFLERKTDIHDTRLFGLEHDMQKA
jgi:hypothetical protein